MRNRNRAKEVLQTKNCKRSMQTRTEDCQQEIVKESCRFPDTKLYSQLCIISISSIDLKRFGDSARSEAAFQMAGRSPGFGHVDSNNRTIAR